MRAIDADAFKDYIRGACEDMKHLFKDNADFAKLITESFCKDIDEQPTVSAEPHWIPVTEDTPKEAGTYMCTCYDAGRRIVTLVKWQPRTKTWNLTGARAYWKVIAWCKCPEPYKGEAAI